jgi:transposase-like protein
MTAGRSANGPKARRHGRGANRSSAKLRRAVRTRGHFPNDESVTKLLFLVLNLAEKA